MATKPICVALALTSLSLAVTQWGLPSGPDPNPVLLEGPITEGQVRGWAARSDWSMPPHPGEPVEWRGERWQVIGAEGESLRVRPPDGTDAADRVAPAGEVRLLGLSRALQSGEVVRYRLHAVREAD
jgi:hypothetical protein